MDRTVREIIDHLDDGQYIAVGSGVPRRKKGDPPSGSGFYFIGKVRKLRRDITSIERYFFHHAGSPKEWTPLMRRKVTDIRVRHIPGEPEMLAILGEGTESGRFALLSECDKSFKAPPTKINSMDGMHELRIGIAKRTALDYEERIMLKKPTDDLDRFLESEWGELITGCSGKKIEEVCQLRAHYRRWRNGMECGKCKRKSCIHNDGTHFTAMEKGPLECPKEKEADEDGEGD